MATYQRNRTQSVVSYLEENLGNEGSDESRALVEKLTHYFYSHCEENGDLTELVLAKPTDLEGVSVQDDEISIIVDAIIATGISVESVGFINKNLSDASALTVCRLMQDDAHPYICSIHTLDLSGNHISGRGTEALCDVLKDSITIKRLKLNWNPLGQKGGFALAELAQANLTLEELSLGSTSLTTDSLIGLMEALRPHKCLQTLDISNPLKPAHETGLVDHVCKFLELNHIIQHLKLDKWGLRDAGACQLATVLTDHPYLQTLSISGNQIGITGAEALATLLVQTSCLVELDLSYNRITEGGARAFGAALPHNEVLKKLNVRCNKISDYGLAELARGMQQNNSITTLLIWDNDFDQEAATEFDGLIQGRFKYLGVSVDICPYLVDGVYHIAEESVKK